MSRATEFFARMFRGKHVANQPQRPTSFPVPDPERLDEVVDHYLKHRALAAALYQAGGMIHIKPSTVARMRTKDRIAVEVDPSGNGGFTIRLVERPPREFLIQESGRRERP